MAFIDDQLKEFKRLIEQAILDNGNEGRQSLIRSSRLIQLIHDAVKHGLVNKGVNSCNVFPHFRESNPEIKIAGELKQKNQDVCVLPNDIDRTPIPISWGPLAFKNQTDSYGFKYSEHSLVINVRSQMSSLAKNSDTLFERTFAEALNLHMRYKNMVLGEVYLIPTYEYNVADANNKIVSFSDRCVDIARYMSFFSSINNRADNDSDYKYERCALLIVDFRKECPRLYHNNNELIQDNLLPKEFPIDYTTLSFDTFFDSLLSVYERRFGLKHLI